MKIEVEEKELVLKNEAGDHVIIPNNLREKVLKLLEEGCHSCIDDLIEDLPVTKEGVLPINNN